MPSLRVPREGFLLPQDARNDAAAPEGSKPTINVSVPGMTSESKSSVSLGTDSKAILFCGRSACIAEQHRAKFRCPPSHSLSVAGLRARARTGETLANPFLSASASNCWNRRAGSKKPSVARYQTYAGCTVTRYPEDEYPQKTPPIWNGHSSHPIGGSWSWSAGAEITCRADNFQSASRHARGLFAAKRTKRPFCSAPVGGGRETSIDHQRVRNVSKE
jgi:hypothetical protein